MSIGHVPGHNRSYNLVYTNAAMFNRELLNEYTCRTPQVLLDHVCFAMCSNPYAPQVHKEISCEDIVMNVVAYHK